MKAVVDCNNFYCSCERLFRPDLERKPLVVLSNNDGCVVSRTDEARRIGVRMAAPFFKERALLEKHKAAVFSSNYNLYGELSSRVMGTLRSFLPPEHVEVYSVDEAFLDMSTIPTDQLSSCGIEMKKRVEQWTGIKVSVGIAPSKVLAKLANRLAKKEKHPDGCLVLDTDEKIEAALARTAVNDLWGIGSKYAALVRDRWGIETALQLSRVTDEWARQHLGGVVGQRLLRELNGESCIEMKDPLETKKMIATTRMFGKRVTSLHELCEAITTYTSRAAEKLRRQFGAAGKIEVFVISDDASDEYRYDPHSRHTYVTLPKATSITHELVEYAVPLLDQLYTRGRQYLKAGVVLHDIVPETAVQGNLFGSPENNNSKELMDTMDNINFSMRDEMIRYASSGMDREWKMRLDFHSPRYTSRWEELRVVS